MLNYLFPVSFSHLPKRLLLLGCIFTMIPLISYAATAIKLGATITDFDRIFSSFIMTKNSVNANYPFTKGSSILEFPFRYYKIFLNIVAVLVGFGLLSVKRWAYFLFLFFMSFLTIHAVSVLLFSGFGGDMIWNFLLTMIYFVIFQYTLNKDISTPYLTLIPRSFRKKWRIEIPVQGKLRNSLGEELSLTTIDISPSGCLATIQGNLELNENYTIILNLDTQWEVNATVVRLDGDQVGLHFNYSGLRDPLKSKLKNYLESKLLPRFSKELPATLEIDEKEVAGTIINISEGGFYFSTQSLPDVDQRVEFKYKFMGIQFQGKGKVSWVNKESGFNKPVGFGVSYLEISHTVIYAVFLFFFRRFNTFNTRER